MVDFNDRRFSSGSSDFNNPRGTFTITTHGDAEEARWSGKPHQEVRGEVVGYYRGQKQSQTWREANRLAKSRADHEARRWGFENGAAYANAYQEHLARVMATKGKQFAERYGELTHKQTGNGYV